MERNYTPNGLLKVVMSSGHSFELPALPEADRDSSTAIIFNATADVVDESIVSMDRVNRDETLSGLGKEQKLDPLRQRAVIAVAAAGVTAAVTQWEPARILKAVRSAPEDHLREGYAAWNLSATDAAEMDRRLAAETRRAA